MKARHLQQHKTSGISTVADTTCNMELCCLLPACDRCQHFNTSCLMQAVFHSNEKGQSAL